MDLEVMPLTEAGRRFVALAEEHARDFATRAERHDREGNFPVENIEAGPGRRGLVRRWPRRESLGWLRSVER